jgi:Protein kinase domain
MHDPVSAARTPAAPLDVAPSGAGKPHLPPVVPDHELIRPIGRGSYGEVWLARNVMGTYRAVKVVYRDSFKDAQPFDREYHGIQIFEPLSRTHPGLIDILQIGRNDREGYFYYVMELADDESSGQAFASDDYLPRTIGGEIRHRGRLPFDECLTLSLSLTAALGHLHKGGLVHRDIKPSNIIFVNGHPKLADIGLVTATSEARSFVGTEGYIPPEGPGTPQSDLYSLGKVIYEISTGKDRQSFPEPPTLLEEFADHDRFLELNEVIIKACESDPRQRYPSAEQMHDDLLLLLGGRSVKRLRLVERRLRIVSRAGLATVAIMIFGAVPYFLAIKEAQHARRAEAETKKQLYDTYLAEAQAVRSSHRVGRRFNGLEALRKAAGLRPSLELLELRNEAIACLALPDIRLERKLDARPLRQGGVAAFDNRG